MVWMVEEVIQGESVFERESDWKLEGGFNILQW